MGGLPDAVRTHFIASEDKEKVLLAKLLLLNNDFGEITPITTRTSLEI